MGRGYAIPREKIIAILLERDGDVCQYPGCGRTLDLDAVADFEVTVDHWIPRSKGGSEDISNYRLFEKRCNALKGDRMPNEDGTLPPRPVDLRPLHQRRADKSARIDVCETCMSGRLLLFGEECPDCGSGPQPSTLPKYLQVSPKECSHGWGENPKVICWMCNLGFIKRRPAMEDVLDTDGL